MLTHETSLWLVFVLGILFGILITIIFFTLWFGLSLGSKKDGRH